MKDLKERTIRGGSARALALGASFAIRVGSLVLLARLLEPKDFGLLGMVTAFTGVLSLFRDFGLSSAAVQKTTVTAEQSSTLFWINVLVGLALTATTAACAPLIAMFYREPRLLWVTVVVSISFLLNAAGVQHSVILQRQMRFTALATIDVASWFMSNVIGISAAMGGFGVWALVLMTVCLPLTNTIGLWLTTAWVPGRVHRGVGTRSLMRFGGTLTLNGIIVYIASNFEKVLLGRFWGPQALGIYGRAYQLIRIPTDNLNSAVGEVAFSALSRIQDDPKRMRHYFMKGYSLVLALTLPLTIVCALFAGDIVFVFLGPKWDETAPIFRLLAPTMLIFAIANPLGWLLNALGLVKRGLLIALVIAPLMIASYVIGLPYGPKGVALSYSAVCTMWLLPVVAWAVHGTVVSFRDILITVARPLVSIALPAGFAYTLSVSLRHSLSPLGRLLLETTVLFIAYFAILLFVAGQKALYLDLFRGFKGRPSVPPEEFASAVESGSLR